MAARVMQPLTYSLFCHGTVKQCIIHMSLYTKHSIFSNRWQRKSNDLNMMTDRLLFLLTLVCLDLDI